MNEDFEMEMTKAQMMGVIRLEFSKSEHIKDLKTFDVLLFRGRQVRADRSCTLKYAVSLQFFAALGGSKTTMEATGSDHGKCVTPLGKDNTTHELDLTTSPTVPTPDHGCRTLFVCLVDQCTAAQSFA